MVFFSGSRPFLSGTWYDIFRRGRLCPHFERIKTAIYIDPLQLNTNKLLYGLCQTIDVFYRFIFATIWLTVVRRYLIHVLQLHQWNLPWCDFQKCFVTWIILYSCRRLFFGAGSLITHLFFGAGSLINSPAKFGQQHEMQPPRDRRLINMSRRV